jgi:hypothetical protein
MRRSMRRVDQEGPSVRKAWATVVALGFLCVFGIAGCASGVPGCGPDCVGIPTPVITSLSPANKVFGGPTFTLTVNGSGFTKFSEVNWNGGHRNTTFVSGTQLTAVIGFMDIESVGTATVSVVNSSNTSNITATSNSVSFEITAGAKPVITSLSPVSAALRGPSFVLTVNGTGFVSASVVNWNGIPRTTTFVSSAQLTATIPASDLGGDTQATANITVTNPLSSGGTSNTVTFTITSNFQIVTASPLPAGMMNSSYSVTVQATGGVGALLWLADTTPNGFAIPQGLSLNENTGVISGTPTQTGSFTFRMHVQDSSSPPLLAQKDFTLVINSQVSPVPNITSISPTSAVSGGLGFSLIVNGTGFVSTSAVNWNGSPRSTTFVNAMQLTTSIFPSDIALPGSFSVTVVNPPPGGGTSNAVAFTVTPAQTAGVVSAISVNNNGDLANLLPNNDLALSATGRFAAFQSAVATNLVSNPQVSQNFDVYFHDNCVGIAVCSQVTQLASALSGSNGNGGFDGNGPSFCPLFAPVSISDDGGFVSFLSVATNLATPKTAKFIQAYVRDTQTLETAMVSLKSDGTEPNSEAADAELSASGRFIAFISDGTDLVTGVTQPGQAYIARNCIGQPTPCSPSTLLASADSDGQPSSGQATGVAVSANGRFVTFAGSFPSFPNAPNGGAFVRDTCINALTTCAPSTRIVPVDNGGTAASTGIEGVTSISNDGRFVAFTSRNVLAPNASSTFSNLYIRDTCQTEDGPATACNPSTTTVSVANDGSIANQALSPINAHMVSGTGRFVVFGSQATNLVPGGTPPSGIFVRDTCTGGGSGCTPTTRLVSVDSSGNFLPGLGPVISSDGHFCAFMGGQGSGTFIEQALLARTGF